MTLHTSSQNPSGTDTVAASGQSIYADIVDQLGITSGQGTLEIDSTQPLFVTSRTYNQASSGTFGQYLEGVEASEGFSSGETVWLPHLMQNPDFRCNIGVANFGTTAATVRITLFDAAGVQLHQFNMNIPPGQVKQDSKPFQTRAGRNDLLAAYASVRATAGSNIVAYASVVDQQTGDATTVPMRR